MQPASVSQLSGTSTSNTCLAAALTAIGIPLAEKPFIQVIDSASGNERTVWFFEPQSSDGKHVTRELIEAWSDKSWHYANPEHPFAYIKCALLNRDRLVDKIKQNAPLVCIRSKGKIAFIPLNATPREEEKYLRML